MDRVTTGEGHHGETPQERRAAAGMLIATYRERRSLSQTALARRVGRDPSTISRIEAGSRAPDTHDLSQLIAILEMDAPDRDRLLRLLDLDRTVVAAADLEEERRVTAIFLDAYRRNALVKRLADQPRYLLLWAQRRMAVGRYQAQRAVRDLERAAFLAQELASDELDSIILLDYADALTLAGALDRSDAVVNDRCLPLGARMLREEPGSQRAQMAMARTVVTCVNTAYNRGDAADCWREHDRAVPHLTAAGDNYGWAKSLFFLALFRFWQGDLTEAEAHARDALGYARAITVRRDYWWGVRDVLWLSRTWWIVILLALLIDILACQGACGTQEFDDLIIEYRDAKPLWVRDFPPFAPRYLWLDPGAADDHGRQRAELERWLHATETGGCWNIHTDLLIVYGDFLRWSALDDAAMRAAERAYQEAKRIAVRRGFGLHERSAELRLGNATLPFPGLAH